MATKQDPSKAHDRWIAIVIWIAALIALVYTSGYATFMGFGGTLTSFYQRLSLTIASAGQDSVDLILSAATLLAMLLLVSQVLLAWRRFATFTNDLIISYARPEQLGSMNMPFFDLLIWDVSDDEEDQSELELDPDQADNSLISEVLMSLGFAWAIILLTPPVLSIIAVLVASPSSFF